MKRFECPKCHTHQVIRLAEGFVILLHCTVCKTHYIVCKHCTGNMVNVLRANMLRCVRCERTVSLDFSRDMEQTEEDTKPLEVHVSINSPSAPILRRKKEG